MHPIVGRMILRPGQFRDLGRHHFDEHVANSGMSQLLLKLTLAS
jgi:hypothetical protein